jgi:glycosyltransferase involved in cell wall biosynthesis
VLWWLLRRRRRLDVVVDADCGIPVFSPLVLRRRRTAVVLLVHHIHLDQFGLYLPAPLAALGRVLERIAMPRIYRGRSTIAVSDSTRREMVGRLRWAGPVSVLHNGRSMSAEAPPVAVHGDPAQSDRLVVLGRLASHKRVDQVVRAVDLLAETRPQLQLDVLGKGPERHRIVALVHELGLEERVLVHGFVSDEEKRTMLRQARLHVCASDGEGWGQVVIEAAACGVPTLARAVPGLDDSIRDGITGWLVPESRDVDLSARLAVGIDGALTELADVDRREDVSRDCRTWAGGFSWNAMHEGAVQCVVAAMNQAEQAPRTGPSG